MKQQELRLGNLVILPETPFEPCEVTIEMLKHFGEDLLPIPLTEEWLIKFGFVEKYMSCHRRWTKDGLRIDQITDEDFEGGKIPQEQIFFYNDKEISYVHQLQNLYFALTEEELQIRQKD